MINRILQLNISQLENSFNSLLEKHFVLDLPSQPNPNLIQLVIARGKLVKCEDNRVMNVPDRTWKLVESSSHKVQEVGSLEHRDTTSSNANKFNLAIDEENIDFKISGVPNAMVNDHIALAFTT